MLFISAWVSCVARSDYTGNAKASAAGRVTIWTPALFCIDTYHKLIINYSGRELADTKLHHNGDIERKFSSHRKDSVELWNVRFLFQHAGRESGGVPLCYNSMLAE